MGIIKNREKAKKAEEAGNDDLAYRWRPILEKLKNMETTKMLE